MVTPDLIDRITEEIWRFSETWLGIVPRLINVDYHQQAIAVTMAGILAKAEKDAMKSRGLSELIARNHVGAYKSVRHMLEAKVAGISGRAVAGSSLMVDPESNCATIIFKFE